MARSQSRDRSREILLPFIVEPSSGRHTHSLIILHGLGSTGEKFGRELLETGICSNGKKLTERLAETKFIFPTSQRRRSSAFSRAMLTQWFDIASLDDPSHRSHTQLQGLEESCDEIIDIFKQEAERVSREKVVLGGISQGCATGLIVLLALNFPIAGFVGMSGWLPFAREIEQIAKGEDGDANPFGPEDEDPFHAPEGLRDETARDIALDVLDYVRDLVSVHSPAQASRTASALSTPIFLGHGDADEKIRPALGESARQVLTSVGFHVDWRSYKDQGHWYKIPDGIDDMVEFIQKRLDGH